MKKLFNSMLIIIFIPLLASADYTSGGFFVVEKSMNFDKTINFGKCYGKIPYPELSHDDEELFMKINKEIYDFVETYAICNQGGLNNLSVTFDMPDSGLKDFFSIRWFTKKDGNLWRIDTLNFNFDNGDILQPHKIFNLLSNHMMRKMIEISEGRLSKNTSWEQFLSKIETRDVQLYLKDKKWYIAFNANTKINDVVDVKIPEYFWNRK